MILYSRQNILYYISNKSKTSLLDIPAIRNTLLRGLRVKLKGKSTYGNKEWKKADFEWYSMIHDANRDIHENFTQYLKSKTDIKTVLEIGCGTGIYPIKNKELFNGLSYTGLDISQENIDYCRKHSDFNYICGDFLKLEISDRYDLIFSHAVIDHVYDIDAFLSKICVICKKYAYINAYRGYFPNLKKHKMNWRDEDGCYYNDISILQAKETLLKNNLKDDEIIIRPQKNGFGVSQTIIEINKK